ncbi:MAG: hypothetical protein ACI8Z7_000058 [Candidatus Nanohaloarchaea archaeon]|jgi:hypothetical protein
MNFLIGLLIALFMFLVIGTLIITSIFDAQGAADGCGPLASIIADISSSAVETC